ncbi:LAQU0S04e01090g1_1 [Lachancea quebecensis]|uniref:LAQU0S04e01090g1_1 n=1 Tax=Lachancea quebecensis TaxID=1654605 RepID=A0A0P1KQE7_9SACH|nr:LAQU0S04e01090g1_1 [Lachancea quebecensis]
MKYQPLGSNDCALSTLRDFVELHGVKLNRGFCVGRSGVIESVRCIGGFVKKRDLDISQLQNGMVELLRIPAKTTFSLETILQFLDAESFHSQDVEKLTETSSKVKELFSECCRIPVISAHASETLLLIIYFIIFSGLERSGYMLPSPISHYLNGVLLTTEIESPYSDVFVWKESTDVAPFAQYGFASIHLIFNALSEFSAVNFGSKHCERTISALMASISSRCLEIPHEEHKGSDDFYVNTTLVPVLDYVNHDNKHVNAHFDIDRNTSDVILVLDMELYDQKEEVFEVFISYSPVDEIVHFEKTYGFSPQPEENRTSFMNLCFDKRFSALQDFDIFLFYKWFSIKPCLQFILRDGRVYINDTLKQFAELLLPYVADPQGERQSCFTYNPNNYTTFSQFTSRARGTSEDRFLEDCRSLARESEIGPSEIIGLPQLAWTCHLDAEGEDFARLNKEQCLKVLFGSDELYSRAIDTFQRQLRLYMNWRLDVLQELKRQQPAKSSANLAAHELYVIQQYYQQLDQDLPVFWTDVENYENLELADCPLPPPLKYSSYAFKPSDERQQPPVSEELLTKYPEEEFLQYASFFMENT